MENPQMMRLPLELIFHIMVVVLPSNPAALIPASDDGTQLLLRFCLVSRATHEFAIRKLQQHCVYLDSDTRLSRFLLCLEPSRKRAPPVTHLPSVFHQVSSVYLAPFGPSIDNLPVAHWTRELFGYTCDTLKRLVVDMPLDSLPPWADHLNVGPVLLQGLEQLRNLEEIVCTRDVMRLGVADDTNEGSGQAARPVMYKWPKLRRLGLNRPRGNIGFWECIADMPNLEKVVLTARPVGAREIDFMSVYLERTQRPISVVFADINMRPFRRTRADNTDNTMRVTMHKIRIPQRRNFFDSHSEWLIGTALAGDLWNINGLDVTAVSSGNAWRFDEVPENEV